MAAEPIVPSARAFLDSLFVEPLARLQTEASKDDSALGEIYAGLAEEITETINRAVSSIAELAPVEER
jgi:hypothetical protein